jgi:DNA-binding response OmpR family regulator
MLQHGISYGLIVLDPDSYEAEFNGEKVELSTKEFELLKFFITNKNHVFTKEQLYENIWGMNEYGDVGTVAVYIKKLRDKMNSHGMDYIKTVWGVGYKLIADKEERSL